MRADEALAEAASRSSHSAKVKPTSNAIEDKYSRSIKLSEVQVVLVQCNVTNDEEAMICRSNED